MEAAQEQTKPLNDRRTSPLRWLKKWFMIQTTRGIMEKKGWVKGYFGIDERDGVGFVVTHLPSGLVVDTRQTLRDAKLLTKVISRLELDWSDPHLNRLDQSKLDGHITHNEVPV